MKKLFPILILCFLSITLFVQSQTIKNVEAYWFLQKNDSLYGVNYTALNKFILQKKLTPKSTVIVAIIDAGFDFSHPDIKSLVWINKQETPSNQKDDDCNGYIDDIHGWNFLGNADGQNIERVATAAFRKYKHLRRIYANADTTLLTPSQKEEYTHYKAMEKEAKLDKYILFEKHLAHLNQMYLICDSLMNECYGNKKTTIKDFYEIDVKDTIGLMLPLNVVAMNISILPKDKPWTELIKEQQEKYDLAHSRVKSLDDFTDDPHIKIGNDPEDFQDFHYGNNYTFIDPYHGTMVAGLVGIANKIGFADIRMMGIRAVPDGDEYDRDIVAAIRYAVDNGAKIINMSFGKKISEHSQEVKQAIKYAQNNDVLIVKSSGNHGLNTDLDPNYPTGTDMQGNTFKNMLIVGSSLQNGTLAPFSNYGKETVDILAPGIEITSTSPDNKYATEEGTSLSAPIVTGIAALLRSYFPNLSAQQVKDIIMQTVTDVSKKKTQLPGNKQKITTMQATARTGGIINAFEAFKKAKKDHNQYK